jgi:hypothetical protein
MTEQDEYEFFVNKKSGKTYISKPFNTVAFKNDDEDGLKKIIRTSRFASKVIDGETSHSFELNGQELTLRVTKGVRHEIKVRFYEDTRGIATLQIQKYISKNGKPNNYYFTFLGNEITSLYNFVRSVSLLPIDQKNHIKIDDKFLEDHILNKEQALKLISDNPAIFREIIKNELTESEIISLGYRKAQLKIFNDLLTDKLFFENYKIEKQTNTDEAVWQLFFEQNTWILGYGLNFIFNTSLQGKKLEQVVSGFNAFESGKRVDALLKSRGIISSLCFAEIKTPDTILLKQVKTSYRPESWCISDQLAGGVAQIQKTVQKSLSDIATKTSTKGLDGNLTGEELYMYQPKSFLLIGSLEEFKTGNGINEDKFSSFELFRKNIFNPDIITFDELYERAKFIISSSNTEIQKTN